MPPTPVHTVGGFTLDAIIHADGRWSTGRLGGNALWASMGVALAVGGRPVAHALVGEDYPEGALAEIASRGVDVDDVTRRPGQPNARVTFAYRADGSRTQPAPPEAVAQLPAEVRPEFADSTRDPRRTLDSLVDGAALADVARSLGGSWHLGLLPGARFAELTTALRGAAVDYVQADCPARSELARDGEALLERHLAALDVFLPSSSDTDVFAPGVDHRTLVRRFHDYGAPVVVLKRGELGAIVSDATTGDAWGVPAIPAPEDVDATGAGDVFCGYFAHAYRNGATLLDAAVEASAAARAALHVSSPLDLVRPRDEAWQTAVATIREGVTAL
ncbi:carbohydrate kinase family protein [Cellulosimicrobium cellulans]|uniref:carbohydrate kinase family protein n=1 Tax=Cellulosimicrobium cellulans TaxID=1710 RepID=UPI00214A06F5|nr:carbohydrate kinase family protein [Cellulosimicrobium cellulans]